MAIDKLNSMATQLQAKLRKRLGSDPQSVYVLSCVQLNCHINFLDAVFNTANA